MKIFTAIGVFKDVFNIYETTEIISDILKNTINSNDIVESVMIADGGEYSNEVMLEYTKCKKIIVNDIVTPIGEKKKSVYLIKII